MKTQYLINSTTVFSSLDLQLVDFYLIIGVISKDYFAIAAHDATH